MVTALKVSYGDRKIFLCHTQHFLWLCTIITGMLPRDKIFSVKITPWDKTNIKTAMKEPPANIFHGSGWRLGQERCGIFTTKIFFTYWRLVSKQVSKFYFAINTSQRKLYKAWKITNLWNLNINLNKTNKQTKKKKQTNK